MRFLLFVVFFFSFTFSQAQYESILRKKNLKYIVRQEIWDFASDYEIQVLDSIQIDGKNYREIEGELGYAGYIREDTVTGKLWYRDKYENWLKDSLIMDLSLSVGDSFNFHLKNYSSFYSKVNSVEYKENRKIITFDFEYGGGYISHEKIQFIEGIGPNTSFFSTIDFGVFGTLICDVTLDDMIIYSKNCPIIVGIKSDTKNKVLSNIVDDILQLKEDLNFQILNVSGVLQVEGFGRIIEISNLNSGIYIVRTISKLGEVSNHRFIKK